MEYAENWIMIIFIFFGLKNVPNLEFKAEFYQIETNLTIKHELNKFMIIK